MSCSAGSPSPRPVESPRQSACHPPRNPPLERALGRPRSGVIPSVRAAKASPRVRGARLGRGHGLHQRDVGHIDPPLSVLRARRAALIATRRPEAPVRATPTTAAERLHALEARRNCPRYGRAPPRSRAPEALRRHGKGGHHSPVTRSGPSTKPGASARRSRRGSGAKVPRRSRERMVEPLSGITWSATGPVTNPSPSAAAAGSHRRDVQGQHDDP